MRRVRGRWGNTDKKTISKAKSMKREKGEKTGHTKNRQSESREIRGWRQNRSRALTISHCAKQGKTLTHQTHLVEENSKVMRKHEP